MYETKSGLRAAAAYATVVTSFLLRSAAFVFLRWIPGHHLPPIIYTALSVFLPAFLYVLTHTKPYDVVANRATVATRDAVEDDSQDVDPRYADQAEAKKPGKELVVEEEVETRNKDPHILWTLLTGLPSPTSLFWSMLTLTINLALVGMTLDLIYRAKYFHPAHDLSFARVGYVSDSTATLLIREPESSQLPIFASYRHSEFPLGIGSGLGAVDTAWKAGGSLHQLDNSTDFTGTFALTGLKSDTRYQYTTSNNHTGYFVTAPRVGHTSTRPADRNTFTFLHSSCIKLRFPYSLFEHPLSAPGLRHVAQTLASVRAQFMLFLGDFIYIDVPKQHGVSLEDFRREYRQVYSSPDWPAASKELPWIHVYDDHEVANDWSGNTTGVFPQAFDPYDHYQISANPPPVRKGESWFQFTQGPASFFMIDTRRYRSPNDATNGSDPITGNATKTMLGAEQLSDLLAWLKRPEPPGVRWKVLVSSIPFTKNWWFGAQDTWRGYLGERQMILEAMWDVGLRGGVGVVVLSGDRHEFAATAFPPPPDGKEEIIGLGLVGSGANPLGGIAGTAHGKPGLRTRQKRWPLSATVHEFSVSPLNMFYLPVRTYAGSSTTDEYVSDVCIKYLPDGNSKFGAVSISNPSTSDQSVLYYRLYVDGKETWSYTLTTPPDVSGGGRSKDAIWG